MEQIDTGPASSRALVLVIDDEALIRRFLARTLTAAGFDVVEADNGERGLEIARASQVSLSLVISDLSMPVMGGLEFARRFRLLNSAVPILLMSGHFDGTASHDAQLKPELLLPKPFTASSLLAAVVQTLQPNFRTRAATT